MSDVLSCPKCGHGYIHQGKVNVFNRSGEDANTGLMAEIDGISFNFTSDMAGNPSPRRNGLTIEFDCESCEEISVLEIIQHKGETFFGWAGHGN